MYSVHIYNFFFFLLKKKNWIVPVGQTDVAQLRMLIVLYNKLEQIKLQSNYLNTYFYKWLK